MLDGLPKNIEEAIGTAGKAIDDAVSTAFAAFRADDPAASVPALVEGLKLTREAMTSVVDPHARHLLRIKEEQFQEAIHAAAGVRLTAMTNPPLMGAPVPGQTFGVDARLEIRGRVAVEKQDVTLQADRGFRVSGGPTSFQVAVAEDVAISTKPYFFRNGLQESVYTLRDQSQFGRPVSPAPLRAIGRYFIGGVPIEIRETGQTDERARHRTAKWCVRCVRCLELAVNDRSGQRHRAYPVNRRRLKPSPSER